MSASANFRIVFALLLVLSVVVDEKICQITVTHLSGWPLTVEKGFSSEEKRSLSARLEYVASRFKRQQVINVSKFDDDNNKVKQNGPPKELPQECGVNGKSINYSKSKNNNVTGQMDWPWIASLLNHQYLGHFCGGVLLNRNYILTAAHCVIGRAPEDFTIRLGEFDFLTMNETESQDLEVEEIKLHQDYDAATQQHDIALVKLKTRVTYTNFIRPICLPSITTSTKTNQTSFVAGWGITSYGGPFSDVLLEVSVPIWDLDTCISHYAQSVFETNICAAGYEGNRDSCAGDSGGPLVIQEKNGRWVNVGVVSWGIGCGNKDEPGVYTSVSSYLDWIQLKMPDAIV